MVSYFMKIRKWQRYLLSAHSKPITVQRSIAFMCVRKQNKKVKMARSKGGELVCLPATAIFHRIKKTNSVGYASTHWVFASTL